MFVHYNAWLEIESRKKLDWQTWVQRSVVRLEFTRFPGESEGVDLKAQGNSRLFTQVCQSRKKHLTHKLICS